MINKQEVVYLSYGKTDHSETGASDAKGSNQDLGFRFGTWCECFFLAAPQHMEFPGQESDPSHSCDLSHSSNAGSLTHWDGLGIKPASQDAEMPPIPFHHSGTPVNLKILG